MNNLRNRLRKAENAVDIFGKTEQEEIQVVIALVSPEGSRKRYVLTEGCLLPTGEAEGNVED